MISLFSQYQLYQHLSLGTYSGDHKEKGKSNSRVSRVKGSCLA